MSSKALLIVRTPRRGYIKPVLLGGAVLLSLLLTSRPYGDRPPSWKWYLGQPSWLTAEEKEMGGCSKLHPYFTDCVDTVNGKTRIHWAQEESAMFNIPMPSFKFRILIIKFDTS